MDNNNSEPPKRQTVADVLKRSEEADVDAMKVFAQIEWTAYDVQSLFDLTEGQAEEWLEQNERRIRDRLIEVGHFVIGDLGDDDDLPRVAESVV